jgi:hypothetical protein
LLHATLREGPNILIAVQNGAGLGRVLHLHMSPSLDAVTAFETLEAGNSDFDVPTTAAVAAHKLYVLANSPGHAAEAGRTVDPAKRPRPIAILELALP